MHLGEKELFSFSSLVHEPFVLAEFDIRKSVPLAALSLECAEGKESHSQGSGSHAIVLGPKIKSILYRDKNN